MLGLLRLGRGLPAKKIGDEGDVARARQSVGDAANLLVDAPPLLKYDDRGGALSVLRLGQVALNTLSVEAAEGDRRSHQ